MKKKWLLVAGLALVLVLVGLAGCQAGSSTVQVASSQQEGIWVNGQGKVTVVPDIALLRLGIEAQEATVAQAQSQASEAMNKVMTALTGNGVAKKDIQTQFFNITKVTRFDDKNQREVIIGYRVTNVVAAKLRDIDKAGSIIDAVAQAGGDRTRIDSISFTIDDPSAYNNEGREKAMADAKAKAEQMARLGGVSLGKPTFISETSYFPPTPLMARAESFAPGGATPISPGEMEITISVQVVYAILK
ncbi:MAG: SIMPL domain-containing protein [Chloroflexi bacterium]|nr:SIMPL domain-containing protein [Chloroflexota bacterium]